MTMTMTEEQLDAYYEDIRKKTEEYNRKRRRDFRTCAKEAEERDAWHIQIQPHEMLTILDALDSTEQKLDKAEKRLAELKTLLEELHQHVKNLLSKMLGALAP